MVHGGYSHGGHGGYSHGHGYRGYGGYGYGYGYPYGYNTVYNNDTVILLDNDCMKTCQNTPRSTQDCYRMCYNTGFANTELGQHFNPNWYF